MSDFSCRDGSSQQAGLRPGLAEVDDVVSITMFGSCVRIESTGPLNGFRTCVVVDAVNAAVGAGSVVSFGTRDIWAQLSPPIVPVEYQRGLIQVVAVGVGVAVVRSEGSMWIIDISGRRFLRSDRQLDLHFVPAAAWSPFVGLWMSADSISACIAEGRYITARRSSHKVPSIGAHLLESSSDRIAS